MKLAGSNEYIPGGIIEGSKYNKKHYELLKESQKRIISLLKQKEHEKSLKEGYMILVENWKNEYNLLKETNKKKSWYKKLFNFFNL